LSFAGEVDRSSLVEPESIFSRRRMTDVGSKLRVAVEVEVVIVGGELLPWREVVLDVFEVEEKEEECVRRRGGGSTGRSERE
jgi:hypothetical protein